MLKNHELQELENGNCTIYLNQILRFFLKI